MKCLEISYTQPTVEVAVVDQREMIQFSKFTVLAWCTAVGHGGFHTGKFDKEPKLRCAWCEQMERKHSGWKKKTKTKVTVRKTC